MTDYVNIIIAKGSVRIYQYSSLITTWTQLGQDIDGEGVNYNFGYSVSMNSVGDRVAIGAPFNDGTGMSVCNYMHVHMC